MVLPLVHLAVVHMRDTLESERQVVSLMAAFMQERVLPLLARRKKAEQMQQLPSHFTVLDLGCGPGAELGCALATGAGLDAGALGFGEGEGGLTLVSLHNSALDASTFGGPPAPLPATVEEIRARTVAAPGAHRHLAFEHVDLVCAPVVAAVAGAAAEWERAAPACPGPPSAGDTLLSLVGCCDVVVLSRVVLNITAPGQYTALETCLMQASHFLRPGGVLLLVEGRDFLEAYEKKQPSMVPPSLGPDEIKREFLEAFEKTRGKGLSPCDANIDGVDTPASGRELVPGSRLFIPAQVAWRELEESFEDVVGTPTDPHRVFSYRVLEKR